MIEIRNLSKSFEDTVVLNDLSCKIDKNVFTALLGASGAGKSTLLRCINGLIVADSGTIIVSDKEIPRKEKDLRKFRKNIGIIFQQFNLVKRLTVLENVLCGRLSYTPFWRSMLKKFTDADYELAEYYLKKVGLYEKRFQRASRLSGGQQQRVAIARALVQQPEILLADEPVASLDPKTARDVMRLLVDISKEEGITLVVTLHSVELAMEYSEKIIGLKKGKIVVEYNTGQIGKSDLLQLYEDVEVSE